MTISGSGQRYTVRDAQAAPDGRFLMTRDAASTVGEEQDRIIVVLNWFEELRSPTEGAERD